MRIGIGELEDVDRANMDEDEFDGGLEAEDSSFGSLRMQREERSSCHSTAVSSTVLSKDASFSKLLLAAQRN